jgi:hypothetical protein
VTRRRTADERRAVEYFRGVAAPADAALAADYLAKAIRAGHPADRRGRIDDARRALARAIQWRTIAANLELPIGVLDPPTSYR